MQDVAAYDLSQSDRMNGFEWAGEVQFWRTPVREAGESGFVMEGVNLNVMRRRGAWSQWIDYTPRPIQVQKVKGKWEVHEDTTLLHGRIPTPADYAKAGVK